MFNAIYMLNCLWDMAFGISCIIIACTTVEIERSKIVEGTFSTYSRRPTAKLYKTSVGTGMILTYDHNWAQNVCC